MQRPTGGSVASTNKPQMTSLDRRTTPTVLSFEAGGIEGAESIVVKFQMEEGTQTIALNPICAHHLGLLLLKGVMLAFVV